MTDIQDFVRQAENDLRNSRSVTDATCELWEKLPQEDRAAFAPAMAFLGCAQAHGSLDRRIAAARLLLLKLGLDGPDPRWSSAVMERLVEVVLNAPGGSVGDLFHALLGLFEDYPSELSRELANFIQDIVVKSYSAHQQSYAAVDWPEFAERISERATKPQLYLALHAIPPHLVTRELAGRIAKGMQGTPFCEEAAGLLAA